MLPARRLALRALGLVRGLPTTGANAFEWNGYALDDAGQPLGAFVVVQADEEEPDEDGSDQEIDAAIVRIRISACATSPDQRDQVQLEVREAMARDLDTFEYERTTYASPERGASQLFEAVSTYRARVFHGQRSPADER